MNRRLLTAIAAAVLLIVASLPTTALAKPPTRTWDRVDAETLGRIDPALAKEMLGGGNRTVSVMVQLGAEPVAVRAAAAATAGRTLSKADKAAIRRGVKSTQDALKPAIARAGGKVQRQYQDAYNGMRVRTSVKNLGKIAALPGVVAVRPIRVVHRTLANALPFTDVPAVWEDYGYTGKGVKIAVIDSGIDYTHAGFGGPGTPAAFAANDPTIVEPGSFPTTKVAGGTDLAGDDYDPESDDPNLNTPKPDPDPIDCITDGHGTHVAGMAAGQGVTGAGATYAGPYDGSLDLASFKVAPGVAPEATLYAFRVFGCGGSTDLVIDAIDAAVAADVDVINMSLGADFGEANDPDAVASNNASKAGIAVVIAAGNSNAVPYVLGSPSTATRAISVAAQDALPSFPLALVDLPSQPDQAGINMNNGSLPLTSPLVVLKASATTVRLGCTAADYTGFNVTGKIVAVKRGVCAFVDKGTLAQAQGASGIIVINRDDVPSGELPVFLGNNPELFTIPMVGLAKDAQPALLASDGQTITMQPNGIAANPAYTQSADFTSMGPRMGDSALKPDVSAPGVSIISTLVGSGTGGTQFSGTSMASPFTAGVAALVLQAHPKWKPAQVKAAIVNTADADAVGLYEPLLAGAGTVQPRKAVDTVALATLSGGVSSLSFGYEPNGRSYRETKKVTITNTGHKSITYDLSASFVGAAQGAVVSISPRKLTVKGHRSRTVNVTISLSRSALAALPSAEAFPDGSAVDTVRGAVTADPRGSARGRYDLNVPFLLVPRGLSNVEAKKPAAWTLEDGTATSTVRVKNTGIHTGNVDQYSWGEWDPKEGLGITDIRATGVQALPGEVAALSPDDRLLVFAVNLHGRWSTPSTLDVEVEIDVNEDGATDYYLVGFDGGALFAGVFDGIPLSFLFDADFNLVDLWPAVAPVNGSTYLLATAASSLGLADGASSFDYDTFVYPLNTLFVPDAADGTGHFDALAPALSQSEFIVLARGQSVTIPLTVDLAAFEANPALGWLIVTNDDANGKRQADRVPIGTLPAP
jgi:subtilisin family serine protease